MGRQWPASVVNALRCLTALVVLMALGTLLTSLLQDALIEAWAEGNPGAREILREGGIEALKASSIALPAFVPVVVVMFVVLLGLLGGAAGVLPRGLRVGPAVAGRRGAAHRAGRRADRLPRDACRLVFVVVCVLAMVVDVAFLFFLAHPDTTEYIRGAWLVHHDGRRRRSDMVERRPPSRGRPRPETALTRCRRAAVSFS